jgi:hypothetical protein
MQLRERDNPTQNLCTFTYPKGGFRLGKKLQLSKIGNTKGKPISAPFSAWSAKSRAAFLADQNYKQAPGGFLTG